MKNKLSQLQGLLSNASQILKTMQREGETVQDEQNPIQEVKEDWEKEFDEKFPATHNVYPSEKEGYLTISEYSVSVEEIKSFIKSIIFSEREKLVKEFTEGKRCLNCGKPKESKLIDICDKCLENN